MVASFLNNHETVDLTLLPLEELDNLLSQYQVIREEETFFNDKIRLLKGMGHYLIQEKSNRQELVVRKMKSEQEADVFIDRRLEIYEQMWNGCGCKVNYYE